MNKVISGLLKNLWTLIGSTSSLFLFLFWWLDENGWEPFIGLCGAGFIFISSLYSYIFYEPLNVPKLELSHEASTGKLPPTPVQYRLGAQDYGKEHFNTITWNYTFFIRNNSTYPAFRIKFHLKDKFSGIQFPKMNKVKPLSIFRAEEMHLQTVERLHKDEPIKPLEKVGFDANYQKRLKTTRDHASELSNSFFPEELENMEILVEYTNEDTETFYTRFYREKSGEWQNIRYNYKPIDYMRIRRFLKMWGKGKKGN